MLKACVQALVAWCEVAYQCRAFVLLYICAKNSGRLVYYNRLALVFTTSRVSIQQITSRRVGQLEASPTSFCSLLSCNHGLLQ